MSAPAQPRSAPASGPSRDAIERLRHAVAAMQAGRPDLARAALATVVQREPRLSDGRRLMGLALAALGDEAGAEAELRAAVAADKRSALAHVALGDLLARQARLAEAERSWRAALALDRRLAAAAAPLAAALLLQGRSLEAARVTTPLVAVTGATTATADLATLTYHGQALAALGRGDEALAAHARAIDVAPRSVAAEHNRAALLGDLGRFGEAIGGTDRALGKGPPAPETWIVKARALKGLGRLDEAEAAFRRALELRPADADAHRDLAQLIWMRDGDIAAAAATLDAAIDAHPDAAALVLHKAKLLEFAGDPAGALAAVQAALSRAPGDAGLRLAAVQPALMADEVPVAVGHARAALTLQPGAPAALRAMTEALLADGDAAQALEFAARLRALDADDQYAIALQATCWRLLGDPAYDELYDYAGLVRAWRVEAPEGWTSRQAWLADLAEALERRHFYTSHPFDQSLRHGSQASHLASADDPAIRGFFRAIDAPIRRHIAAMGKGRDPLRRRIKGGWALNGAWSVRLRGRGHHADHVHPEGWLSSAFYVDLPRATAGSPGREGWIQFGRSGTRTRPALAAEHFVEPEPSLLVLFPSYMWHGTVPFTGDDRRLTIAFDILPAKG